MCRTLQAAKVEGPRRVPPKHQFDYSRLSGRRRAAALNTPAFWGIPRKATVKEKTVRFWFQRFRSGNFDRQNILRGRPESLVDNKELEVIVEADPSRNTSELAAGFGWLSPEEPAKFYHKQKLSQKKATASTGEIRTAASVAAPDKAPRHNVPKINSVRTTNILISIPVVRPRRAGRVVAGSAATCVTRALRRAGLWRMGRDARESGQPVTTA
ncbi:hypothetical protein EVAR_76205_1 [Eumeta japonica]|uniref:Histone-lysine N-methyltransferase SETMAR n=1 Tax=Eumeta variegata TaxID=151549 RepID=A0A4C1UQJ7_EUMVA|nr:hypothetical protein EVAR_76205_1 [Eumeta japonica]